MTELINDGEKAATYVDFVQSKIKLKAVVKELREAVELENKKSGTPSDEYTFLISYLISTINLANDIDFLNDWSRETGIEGLWRIFLENYAEFYQLASKYKEPIQIRFEKNYLFLREIRRNNLTLQRTLNSTSIVDKDDLIKAIIENTTKLINRAFPSEVTCLVTSTTQDYVDSVKKIVEKIGKDPSLIDPIRVKLAKGNGGGDFVVSALNANPVWGSNGYYGCEIIYGVLSETVHANVTATLSHSQSNGEFSFCVKNPNIISIIDTIRLSLMFMKDLFTGLGL